MTRFTKADGQLRLLAAVTRLHRLADDLTKIAADEMPTPEDLEDAPILDRYAMADVSLRCLIGQQSGHPELQGKFIRTSELWFMAPDLGWARTLSRFYRLGRPLKAGCHS